MAAVFGVIPKYQTRTIWFSRPTPVDEIVALLENVKLNADNQWYSRLLHITDMLKAFSRKLSDIND